MGCPNTEVRPGPLALILPLLPRHCHGLCALSHPRPLLLPEGVRLSFRVLWEDWRQQSLQGGQLRSVAGRASYEGEPG